MNLPGLLPAPLNVTPEHNVPRVTWINAAPLVAQLNAELNLRALRGETRSLDVVSEKLEIATLSDAELQTISRVRLHAAQTGDFSATGAHRLVDTKPKQATIGAIFSTGRRQFWRVQITPDGPLFQPAKVTTTQKGTVRLDLKRARPNTWLPSVIMNAALLHEHPDDLKLAGELGCLLAHLNLNGAWTTLNSVHHLRQLLAQIQLLTLAQLSGQPLPVITLHTALRALAFWHGHLSVRPMKVSDLMQATSLPRVDWSGQDMPHFGPLPGTLHLLDHFARQVRTHPPVTTLDRIRALLRDHALWTTTFQSVPKLINPDPATWPRCVEPDPHDPELARLSGLLRLDHLRPQEPDWIGQLKMHIQPAAPLLERRDNNHEQQVLHAHGVSVTVQGPHSLNGGLLTPRTGPGIADADAVIAATPGLLPDQLVGPTQDIRLALIRAPQQLSLSRRGAGP